MKAEKEEKDQENERDDREDSTQRYGQLKTRWIDRISYAFALLSISSDTSSLFFFSPKLKFRSSAHHVEDVTRSNTTSRPPPPK